MTTYTQDQTTTVRLINEAGAKIINNSWSSEDDKLQYYTENEYKWEGVRFYERIEHFQTERFVELNGNGVFLERTDDGSDDRVYEAQVVVNGVAAVQIECFYPYG